MEEFGGKGAERVWFVRYFIYFIFFLVCGSRAGPGPGPSPGNGTGPLRCKVARRSVPAYGEAG